MAAMALLLLPWPGILAQPYAAGGGFDRPRQVADTATAANIAMAADADGALFFWSDRDGILRQQLGAAGNPERVVEARGTRHLAAAEVHGAAALAWVIRDLATGRTTHWLRWRGQERLLLDTLQPYDLSIVEAPSGPAVLIARREGSETVLRMIGWDGGETVIRRSELSLVRYRAVFGDDGVARVLWLEGFTDRNAVGFSSADWTAYLAEVGPEGPTDEPLRLGPARYRGVESQTALSLLEDRPFALWPGPDGEVLFATPGREPVVAGQGSPVAVVGSTAYWAEGASIKRRKPYVDSEAAPEPATYIGPDSGDDPSDGPGADVDDGGAADIAAENVSWSPVTVQRAELVEAGDEQYLAWYGPTRGGGFRLFAADDRRQFRPDLRDRTAAAMGWSPWGFWEALFGQVLGALFAGMLITMALSPLLWLGATLSVHTRWARWPTVTGVCLGAILMAGLLALAAARSNLPPDVHASLFGTIPELSGALVLATALTWWLRRGSDSEQLIGVLGSGWLFVFVGTSTLAFITFQAWLEYWTSVV